MRKRAYGELTDLLDMLWEYFDDLSDIESDGSPNEQLRLATYIQEALADLGRERVEREFLFDEAERLIFDMKAVLDLHNIARGKVEQADAFLAKLEARDA